MKARTIQLLLLLTIVLATYIFFRWDGIFSTEPVPAVPEEIETPAAEYPTANSEHPTAEALADNWPHTEPSTKLPNLDISLESEKQVKGPGIIQPKSGFKQQAADADQPRIIGGDVVVDRAYPWSVALVKVGDGQLHLRQFCGGTLISPEWVITAAHCTFRGPLERPADSFSVLFGTNTLDDGQGQEVAVREIIRHPEYHRPTATLDVALLRLAEPVDYPVIELGDAASLSEVARASALTLGWGKTEDASRSKELRQVNVPLVDDDVCQAAYAEFSYIVNDAMICAGYAEGGKDACVGDSGGPIVVPDLNVEPGETPDEWLLVGVVSWGKGCAQANAYGVYVDVGHIIDWINDHVVVISTADYAGAPAPPGEADIDAYDVDAIAVEHVAAGEPQAEVTAMEDTEGELVDAAIDLGANPASEVALDTALNPELDTSSATVSESTKTMLFLPVVQ